MALPRARSRFLRLSALCVGLALSLVAHASRVRAQAPRGLFSDERDARTLAPAPAARDPLVLRNRTATVNLTMLTAPGLAGTGVGTAQVAARTVDLNLFSDVNLVAQFDHVETVPAVGGHAWVGTVAGVEASQVILAVADGVFTGAVLLPTHTYSVHRMADGIYAIAESNDTAILPDAPPLNPHIEPTADVPPTGADSGDTFDLLLYYTTTAKNVVGGTAAVNSFLTASIAQVNAVYAESGIPSRLRLVAANEAPQEEETGDISKDLSVLRANPDVQAMRNRVGADFVTMLVSTDPQYSGVAYIMTGVTPSFESAAYSVVVYSRGLGYIRSLAHELGHNMGCEHEPGNNGHNGAFSYSQGYTDFTNRFYTVMSYGLNCTGGCARINQFSSPVNTYQGKPVGTATQDNQRTIVITSSTVANFRQALGSQLSPPTNLVASASGSTVALTWSAPTTGTPRSYVIEAGSSTLSANLAQFDTHSTSTSFSASGVGDGLYYVRVKAFDGANDLSPASNEVGLLVGACAAAPLPPLTLTSYVLRSTVYLAWTASAAATSYVVEAGSQSGLSNLANSDLGSALNMYTATGVGAGTYYVRMRAKNACGLSAASNQIVVIVR